MSCLQIQENDKTNPDAWQLSYCNIEGFDYGLGFVCKIKVRETELDKSQVPADSSFVMYELVEVLAKQAND